MRVIVLLPGRGVRTLTKRTLPVDYGFCYTVNYPCLDCRLLTFRLEGPLLAFLYKR